MYEKYIWQNKSPLQDSKTGNTDLSEFRPRLTNTKQENSKHYTTMLDPRDVETPGDMQAFIIPNMAPRL
jgi:hypothetical protein